MTKQQAGYALKKMGRGLVIAKQKHKEDK